MAMILPSSEGPSRALKSVRRLHSVCPRWLRGRIRRRWLKSPHREGLRGNPEHLAKLLEGQEVWNEWRRGEMEKGERGERADLKGFNLRGRNLNGYELRGVDFQEANLRKGLLRSNLRGALLLRADLRGADLNGAWLDDKETDLRGADCRAADFAEALLDEADLRSVKGIILDSSRVRNARFSATANDPWSILRRAYTGPRLVFNFLILLVFLAPYAAKTVGWIAVDRAEESAKDAVTWLADKTNRIENGGSDNQVLHAAAKYLVGRAPSQANGWREYKIWQLLIGVDRAASFWMTAIVLLVYNLGRSFLTLMVAPLRDEEERSGHGPAYKADSIWQFRNAYGWMVWPHRLVRTLFLFAVFAFAFHLHSWLGISVLLPPQ